jgi:hypothetical protein
VTPFRPNREQWWVIWATYAALLFVQRERLQEADIATAFVIVGAVLLASQLHGGRSGALDMKARLLSPGTISVIAILTLGAVMLSDWPSSRDDEATSSAPFEADSPPPAATPAPDAQAPSPAPDEQAPISPLALNEEFLANPAAANRKYVGRFIEVTGVVADVQRIPDQVPYVELVVQPRSLDFMQAMFPENSGQIEDLREGDRITVSCSLFYDGDVEMVILSDCSLVQ